MTRGGSSPVGSPSASPTRGRHSNTVLHRTSVPRSMTDPCVGRRRKPASGILQKWTNYVSGWQLRYFEVRDGTLVYFRAKEERNSGCRGSICLKTAIVQATDDFQLREFTVRINDDIVWHLKAETQADRDRWLRRLAADYDSDYSSNNTHSRTPSVASSVNSTTQQPEPATVSKKAEQLASQVVDLAGYRELCAAQMAEIEHQLTEMSSTVANSPLWRQKLLTIKATHIALLTNLDRCVQIGNDMADMAPIHKSPSASVIEPTITMERSVPTTSTERQVKPTNGYTSDDEDLWHDAVSHKDVTIIADDSTTRSSNAVLPTVDEGVAESTSTLTEESTVAARDSGDPEQQKKRNEYRHLPFGSFDRNQLPQSHSLTVEIDQITKEQLRYALTGANDPTMWTLFSSDGEMKMYKREEEVDGLPVDPLKALHSVQGVSALEYLHYFFEEQYKVEWDHTLNGPPTMIEKISQDAVVILQKHKTIWPAAPRESLFWSHLRRVDEWKSERAHDCYVVCNHDVKRADVPLSSSSAIRVGLTVAMICETHIDNPKNVPISELPRSAFTCKIIYVSSVHPGGWVPTSALRQVYKREYPKFLRAFTKYVLEKVSKKQEVAL